MGNDDTAMVTVPTENPWLRADVASAQFELVTQQLADDAGGNSPPPFAAFRRALSALQITTDSDGFQLLDVGCGVGHYGVLCERYFSPTSYYGSDVSAAMLDRAEALHASLDLSERILVCKRAIPFAENPFGDFGVVFTSQTVDVTDNPVGNLRFLLAGARKYVILHRLRIPPHVQGADKASIQVVEDTYCGHAANNFLWNRDELMQIVGDYGQVIYADEWDKLLTLIVEKP